MFPIASKRSVSAQRVADATKEYWRVELDDNPQLHAAAGLRIDRLPGLGHDDATQRAARGRQIVGSLADLDPERLEGDDADTLRALRFLSESDSGVAEHFWQTPIATPYQTHFRLAQHRRDTFGAYRFSESADVDRYLNLIAQYAGCFDAVRKTVLGQAERGIIIPKLAQSSAVATYRGLRDTSAQTLIVDRARLQALSSKDARRLHDGVSKLVEQNVFSSIDRLLSVLDSPEYLSSAPDNVGMAVQPGGEEAYRFMVRRLTSLDVTPEELHRTGLEQCDMISEQMREIRLDLGFNMDEATFSPVLKVQPQLYASSPAEVEARYRNYMARLEPQINEQFSVLQKAPYDVARVEPELESGMTFGYYEVPSVNQPVGRYRYNGSHLEDRSLLSAAALIYHELVPGHHLHFSRQAENPSLPDFRRYTRAFGAFDEGWAEYASGLGWDMGLYEDPWDAYGRLSHARFIATRLVVDTALNCGWWDLDQALGFMRQNMSLSESQLKSEAIRYSTDFPAQALGYRAGYLAINRMRSDAERRLGDRFQIRDFHEAILSAGALPYTVLEERLKRELI